MSCPYFIGLDMGGTNLRCGAVSKTGEVLAMAHAPACAERAAEAVAASIAGQVRALERLARRRGLGAPAAIGIAVPGPLDLTTGTVVAAPHVAAWRNFPLRRRLERELGRPVTLENDANAWALGEFWRGAARGASEVVLLTLGTGVGGGVIVDGQIVHGKLGMAGELGHITVDPEGPRCDCGSRGCLESYASASGLARLVVTGPRARRRTATPASFADEAGNFSARRLFAAARAGNRTARAVLAIAGKYLGIAIASLINVFDPELVVLGGGVAGALPMMRAEMMREVRARAMAFKFSRARIVRAALGGQAGVVGAAYAAMTRAR